MGFFFDKKAMKNNLQFKIQITYFLKASKSIDFDHVGHVIFLFVRVIVTYE